MATLQIRIDDTLKKQADTLFSGLGLDTSTAIRIFLNAAIEDGGIPFLVRHKPAPAARSKLSAAEFDAMMARGLEQARADDSELVSEVFSALRRGLQ